LQLSELTTKTVTVEKINSKLVSDAEDARVEVSQHIAVI
jgi:hypothetical protein